KPSPNPSNFFESPYLKNPPGQLLETLHTGRFPRIRRTGNPDDNYSSQRRLFVSRWTVPYKNFSERYFISFLTTWPPFITKRTRLISVMSASGSPETAIRSAYLPFSTAPTRSCQPIRSAATEVADCKVFTGSIPHLTK